jgi:formiminoglutamase
MIQFFEIPESNFKSIHQSRAFFKGDIKNLSHHDIMIFHLEDEIPEEFYAVMDTMDYDFFQDLEIAFMGKLKKDHLDKLPSVINFCKENHIIPIILGLEFELINCVTEAYEANHEPHRISLVSPNIDCLSRIDPFLSVYTNEIYALGMQRQLGLAHTTADPNLQKSVLLLSEYRKSQYSIEPYLRNSELIYFDLNSVRASDSPGNIKAMPSGFFSEEASSIAKMCGNGDKMEAIIISPWQKGNDLHNVSSLLVHQMIWYFIEGHAKKKMDSFNENDNITQYIVHFKEKHIDLKFFKSEVSGKWWVANIIDSEEKEFCKIPCSYEEYQASAKDKIPPRILHLIN